MSCSLSHIDARVLVRYVVVVVAIVSLSRTLGIVYSHWGRVVFVLNSTIIQHITRASRYDIRVEFRYFLQLHCRSSEWGIRFIIEKGRSLSLQSMAPL